MIAVVRSDSVIDRRSTAENCRNRGLSRWHGGNFEHVQNFRSATAGWANPLWGRRSTAMTVVAPYKDRSSTYITAVPPQSRMGDPIAMPWRFYCGRRVWRVGEKLWKTTGGINTVMAVLTKNRSGTVPPVWRGYNIITECYEYTTAVGISVFFWWLHNLVG